MIARISRIDNLPLLGMTRSRLWEVLWGYRLAGHETDADMKLIQDVREEWERVNGAKWR